MPFIESDWEDFLNWGTLKLGSIIIPIVDCASEHIEERSNVSI